MNTWPYKYQFFAVLPHSYVIVLKLRRKKANCGELRLRRSQTKCVVQTHYQKSYSLCQGQLEQSHEFMFYLNACSFMNRGCEFYMDIYVASPQAILYYTSTKPFKVYARREKDRPTKNDVGENRGKILTLRSGNSYVATI